jgi:beta-glucosidase
MPRFLWSALALALAIALPAHAAPGLPPAPLGHQPFLWGVTLAGYQNDGGAPADDWMEYENQGGVPERSQRSADFRGHMDEDLDHARSLGLNAFRTSIEWARLEPEEGHWDPQEVAYVHRLLQGIRKRGMTPVIALHHFATPRWAYRPDAEGRVGWEGSTMVDAFSRYVEFVVREFGQEIGLYLTFNEPSSVLLGGYLTGFIPPHRSGPLAFTRATANMLEAHKRAYDLIHAAIPDARVSVPDYNCLLPVGPAGVDWTPGRWFVGLLPGRRGWDGVERPRYLDYVAVHYYGTNNAFTAYPIEPERWAGNPAHFTHVLEAYWHDFHLPILVAENGFATHEGQPRADGWTRESYIAEHVAQLQRTMARGVPVIGYTYWTLTDNYEWGSFNDRFGLYEVDCRHGSYTRVPTPAVDVYQQIVAARGMTPELLARYGYKTAEGRH